MEKGQTNDVNDPTCAHALAGKFLRVHWWADKVLLPVWNIEAPPSVTPQKKYCDITGLEAPYTDPKTGLRYHNADIYQFIKTLNQSAVQQYLALRNANVILK
ncbi:chromatin-remodeling complex subunit ies6 [Rhizophlyctis rosea]|uniref:Chromatin-remodeling complex subunit ies6 n=1 Tax=Rhizophlyctis rosea TaxID=64517 RepID=A0AAD5SA03_9FUNG|nr:chromatin-remodeling complex subunit ies6 [Rhizophlyctis rosea]